MSKNTSISHTHKTRTLNSRIEGLTTPLHRTVAQRTPTSLVHRDWHSKLPTLHFVAKHLVFITSSMCKSTSKDGGTNSKPAEPEPCHTNRIQLFANQVAQPFNEEFRRGSPIGTIGQFLRNFPHSLWLLAESLQDGYRSALGEVS